jgi:hypothetical protein
MINDYNNTFMEVFNVDVIALNSDLSKMQWKNRIPYAKLRKNGNK